MSGQRPSFLDEDSITGRHVTELIAAATGREARADAVLPYTGGPAGNARLTAWTGLVLLPLVLAEMVTLVSIRQLISWHIVIGALLVPPALLKTATTGWRILRYYTGHHAYRHAGPPPLLLRLLGPIVVVSTLAVLGSGLALIALGPDATHSVITTIVGQRVDALTVHQASFAVWLVATGLHVLARTIPALRLATGAESGDVRVGGVPGRLLSVALSLVAGAVAAVLVLAAAHAWTSSAWLNFGDFGGDG
jgi:hypothetical protein